jgi:hypothetical protein
MKRVTWTLLAGALLGPHAMAQESVQPPRELPRQEPAPAPAPGPAATPETLLPAGCNDGCAPAKGTRCFLEAQYLLWWVKRAPLPAPLITTSVNLGEGLPAEFTGSLSDPGTQSLIGGHDMNFGAFSGLRVRGGAYYEPLALELGGHLLERRSGGGDVSGDSQGFPFIAQTFFDVVAGQENSYFISVPIFSSGAVVVSDQIRFYGAEANVRVDLGGNGYWNWAGFIGHRFLALDENLRIDQSITSFADPLNPAEVSVFFLGQPIFGGGRLVINDEFRCTNRFFGGQVGTVSTWQVCDNFELALRGSLGFGVTQQLVEIKGYTTLHPDPNDPDQSVRSAPGGIYAQPSNMGRYYRSEFSFVSEGELNLRYRLSPTWTASLGYSLMFWTNVVRPGDHLDRRLNRQGVPSDPTFQEGVAATAPFSFQQTDFWAQGFNFGLEWRF